jgi:RNA polymerase sigma-70 factor (ECF subfamily)
MVTPDVDDVALLDEAAKGNAAAQAELLLLHQNRLRQMIAVRMDPRLAPRIDPSDVVQETLAQAVQQLPEYLRKRPLPFYPWLRQLAWKRLVDLHRRHVRAGKRSVRREEYRPAAWPDESALGLAARLLAKGSSPSARLRRQELRELLQAALARLPQNDREILILRHLEQLSVPEIAAILAVSQGAVYTRHLRALERLRQLLGNQLAHDAP